MNSSQNLYSDEIIREMITLGEDIYREPELGYREIKTARKIMDKLDKYHIPYQFPIAQTGITATVDSGRKGPHIGLICELDAVPTPGHPLANQEDGAAHTCGHYAQVGVMLAVFCTLKEKKLMEDLCGKVTLIATPAEEFCDFAFRRELMAEGRIGYMSGKQEMISLGIFDDMDLILSCHTLGTGVPYDAEIDASLNGFLSKRAVFRGKAAHAGSYPSDGVNALNAAVLSMSAMNFLRETFREEDAIRLHFILSDGGQSVNSVPERTELEMYIRAKNLSTVFTLNDRVDRCLQSGALAVGCDVEVINTPGYFPLRQDRNLSHAIEKNILKYIPSHRILRDSHGFASGDMGDISMLLPTVEIGIGGFSGTIHGDDFKTEDTNMAYGIPVRFFLDSIADLLSQNGEKGYFIMDNFKSGMDKQSYLQTLESFRKKKTFYKGEKNEK